MVYMANQNQFPDLRQLVAALERYNAQFPTVAAVTALNFFRHSFRQQGFTDRGLSKWKKRSPDNDPGRAVLVKTGALRNSLKYTVAGRRVTISTDIPYAQIHNEGGTASGTANVRAHTRKGHPVKAHSRRFSFTMPKRQFLGPSHQLRP